MIGLLIDTIGFRRNYSESTPRYNGQPGLRINSLNLNRTLDRSIQRDPSTDIRTFNSVFNEENKTLTRYSRFQDQSQSISFFPNSN